MSIISKCRINHERVIYDYSGACRRRTESPKPCPLNLPENQEQYNDDSLRIKEKKNDLHLVRLFRPSENRISDDRGTEIGESERSARAKPPMFPPNVSHWWDTRVRSGLRCISVETRGCRSSLRKTGISPSLPERDSDVTIAGEKSIIAPVLARCFYYRQGRDPRCSHKQRV